MEAFTGRLSDESGTLDEEVEGTIEEEPSIGRFKLWRGDLTVSEKVHERIRLGGDFRLSLDDGTSMTVRTPKMPHVPGKDDYRVPFKNQGGA